MLFAIAADIEKVRLEYLKTFLLPRRPSCVTTACVAADARAAPPIRFSIYWAERAPAFAIGHRRRYISYWLGCRRRFVKPRSMIRHQLLLFIKCAKYSISLPHIIIRPVGAITGHFQPFAASAAHATRGTAMRYRAMIGTSPFCR